MLFRKKLTNFVSEVDIFLEEFNKTHPKSETQLAEIKKYLGIEALRNRVNESKSSK